MKNKIYALASAIVVAIAIIVACVSINAPTGRALYFCNNHPMSEHIDIDVKNDNNDDVYNITNVFFDYTDTLVLDDCNGNALREMDTDYNFVSQNDHVILNGNGMLYSCEDDTGNDGPKKVFNNHKEQVGIIEYNRNRTKLKLKNLDGLVVAECNSSLLRTDYAVTIFEQCEFDDESVIMMFSSYMKCIVNVA